MIKNEQLKCMPSYLAQVTLLTLVQEVSGLIPGSAMGLSSSRELFHGIYVLGVFMSFLMFCPVLALEEAAGLY